MNYPILNTTMTATANKTTNETSSDTFRPYRRLQFAYGRHLDTLNSEVTILAITALGFSMSNQIEVSKLLKCGSYYDALKKFPELTKVISDERLTEWDKTNLLRLLAECL